MTTTSGGLPLMQQTQSSRYLTYNELAWALNVLQTGVLARDLTAPPGSPSEGDAYIVDGPATGAWAGHEDDIAFFFGGIWNFLVPELAQGNGLYVADEGVRVNWVPGGSPVGYQIITSGSSGDAVDLTYTPTTPADWDGSTDPGNGQGAFDQLAERVKDLETSGSTAKVAQIVQTQSGAVATGTTIIPLDDTIPQSGEGDQYMSLSITPTSATNKLLIEVVWNGASSAAPAQFITAALFQDATANALACGLETGNFSGDNVTVNFSHTMTAGTTSATTFKVRAGANAAGTTTFNGRASARLFGGVIASSITITEYVP